MQQLKIVAVATKAPWPPVDGGRLLLWLTLEALAAAGHRVTLVAPVSGEDAGEVRKALAAVCTPRLVVARPRPRLLALAGRMPFTLARHAVSAVRREVERLLAGEPFDVVHAEQLQALPQAVTGEVPVVLRAQNVESDLWRLAAERSRGMRRFWLAREAERLARWEGRAVGKVAATLALTERDADRLRALAAGKARVEVVPAPFPQRLPAGPPLAGQPAVVLMGSGGWLPNEDSVRWFAGEVWPRAAARLPGAMLHLFGGPRLAGERIVLHPPPADSAEAFARGSVLVVPLRIASGVRMKVLEAWARGVAVVGTPEGLSGLVAEPGQGALIAREAEELAGALARLEGEPGLAEALCAAGRKALAERHRPEAVASRLAEVYREVSR